jgi:hypothetical protein
VFAAAFDALTAREVHAALGAPHHILDLGSRRLDIV